MQYSLPYILFIGFLLGIAAFQLGMPFEEKSRKYLNYIVIIAYFLFFGFRGFIGTDWINYYPFFKSISSNLIDFKDHNKFEIGFLSYATLIKKIFDNYEFFQLINTLTNVLLLHIIFKRHLPTKDYALGFAVFVVFYGSILEVNLLRNFKTTLLFLLALPYIKQRNPIKYFSLVSIGILFHWSGIIYLPLYFFLHKKISLVPFLLLFIIGSLIYLFQIEFISPIIKAFTVILPNDISLKIIGYLHNTFHTRSYGFTFGYFERTMTTFLILLYYEKLTKDGLNILFINSFFIFVSLYLFCSEFTIVLERVACNFSFSYWILIPLIIITAERNIKPILTVIFAIILLAKTYIMMNNILFDYDSFLFGESKTYKQRYIIYLKEQKSIEKKQ